METLETSKEKQQKRFKIKTKDIALAAVLTAISILIPAYAPSIPFDPAGAMTVTPFSHLPIFIASFINPFVAIFTCGGTVLGFFIKGANPVVLVRAASHIIFTLVCSLLMKKGKGYRGLSFYVLCGIVTVLHAAAEILVATFAVHLGFLVPPANQQAVFYVLVTVGLLTAAHSIFDYSFAVLIYNTLSQARLVNNRFDLRITKKIKPAEQKIIPNEI